MPQKVDVAILADTQVKLKENEKKIPELCMKTVEAVKHENKSNSHNHLSTYNISKHPFEEVGCVEDLRKN